MTTLQLKSENTLERVTFTDISFFLMMLTVYLFNFNTDRLMGLSGNSITNICVLLFMACSGFQTLKAQTIKWNYVYLYLSVFLMISLVSCFASYCFEDSVSKLETLLLVFTLSFLIFQYITREHKLAFALRTYSLSGFITAIYILLKTGITNGDRLGDVVGDSNLIGITLALSCTAAMFLLYYDSDGGIARRGTKLRYLIRIITMGLIVFLTGSRTASLLLIIAAVILIYVSASVYQWKASKVLLITAFLGAALLACGWLIMNVPYFYSTLGVRIISFFQVVTGQTSQIQEQSTTIRGVFAVRAFKWFLERPIFGNGIGAFPAYNQTFTDGWYCFSHCNYTELLASVGLLGFLAYYGIFIKGLFQAVWNRSSYTLYTPLLIAFLIETLIGDIGLVVYYEKVTWILIALIAAMISYKEVSYE